MNVTVAVVVARCIVAVATVVSCAVMILHHVDFKFVLFIAVCGIGSIFTIPIYTVKK